MRHPLQLNETFCYGEGEADSLTVSKREKKTIIQVRFQSVATERASDQSVHSIVCAGKELLDRVRMRPRAPVYAFLASIPDLVEDLTECRWFSVPT